MKKAARPPGPLVRLAPSINHEVDGDFKSPKLSAEPAVLLPAPAKVRLDHEQVQVTVRPTLAAYTRAEENDLRSGRSRREPTSSLVDQSLVGQRRHDLRIVVGSTTDPIFRPAGKAFGGLSDRLDATRDLWSGKFCPTKSAG
jgi:hypothetical protein